MLDRFEEIKGHTKIEPVFNLSTVINAYRGLLDKDDFSKENFDSFARLFSLSGNIMPPEDMIQSRYLKSIIAHHQYEVTGINAITGIEVANQTAQTAFLYFMEENQDYSVKHLMEFTGIKPSEATM